MSRPWRIGGLAVLTAGMCASAAPVSAGVVPRLSFVGFALAASALVWHLSRHNKVHPAPLRARHVLLVAVALRAVAIPLCPVLSDDGYRYLWDGRLTVNGVSPYAERPRALASVDPALFARLNSPDFYSVYPPLPQSVFALSAWLGNGHVRWSWWILKLLTTGVELVGVVALLHVASPARVVLYAWSPLAIVEVAGQGHTEGLLVGALGVTVWALDHRPRVAGVPAALAAAVKLWPVVVLLPALRRGGPGGIAAAGWVGILGIGPLLAPGVASHVGDSLALYAGHFDWYAPLYRAVKSAAWLVMSHASGPAAAGLMTLAWGGLVAVLTLTDDGSRQASRRVVVGMVAGYVVLSPVLHPWHLLPLLAVLPLLQLPLSPFLLASLSTGTYLAYVSPAAIADTTIVLGWGSAAAALLASGGPFRRLMRRRARDKWGRLAPAFALVPSGARLLDLGCGEGDVGHAAAEATGAAVTAADVVDFRRVPRPLVPLPGLGLPFADRSFQGTFLSYVLHHAVEPERVVREALRVTDGPVVALESVVRWNGIRPLLQTLDHLVNQVRSHSAMENQRPAWRSVAEWQAMADEQGWTLAVTDVRGWLHPTAVLSFSINVSTVAASASSQSADSRRRNHVH